MENLHCTCGTGSGGTVQEEIERRLAARLGIQVGDAHALLDLMDRALDEALDLPESERRRDGGETARRMSVWTGVPIDRIAGFLNTYERVTKEIEAEGLYPTPSDYLGIPRQKG